MLSLSTTQNAMIVLTGSNNPQPMESEMLSLILKTVLVVCVAVLTLAFIGALAMGTFDPLLLLVPLALVPVVCGLYAARDDIAKAISDANA